MEVPLVPFVDADVEAACLRILQRIPRDRKGHLTSVGSMQHSAKACSPCVFWISNSCAFGVACTKCHYDHGRSSTKMSRVGKKGRETNSSDRLADSVHMKNLTPVLPVSVGFLDRSVPTEHQVTKAQLQQVAVSRNMQISVPKFA